MEIIQVTYHFEPDGWWAESTAIAGWSAAAATVEQLHALVEAGVRFALERDDVIIQHGLEGSFAPVVFDFVAGAPRLSGARSTGELPRPRRPLAAV